MVGYYDEIEIEDMTWDDEAKVYHYPCPCGDRFEISRAQLAACEDIAICPSCSLIIRVIYDPVRSVSLTHLLICATNGSPVHVVILQLDYEDYEEHDEVPSTEESEPKEKDDADANPTKAADPSVADLSNAAANIRLTDGETPSEQNVPINIVGEPIDRTKEGSESKRSSEGEVAMGIASPTSAARLH